MKRMIRRALCALLMLAMMWPVVASADPATMLVEGVLTTQTQESDLADAAYTLQLTHIEKYEY